MPTRTWTRRTYWLLLPTVLIGMKNQDQVLLLDHSNSGSKHSFSSSYLRAWSLDGLQKQVLRASLNHTWEIQQSKALMTRCFRPEKNWKHSKTEWPEVAPYLKRVLKWGVHPRKLLSRMKSKKSRRRVMMIPASCKLRKNTHDTHHEYSQTNRLVLIHQPRIQKAHLAITTWSQHLRLKQP